MNNSFATELMELGKQKGQLTNQDILDAIGEIDFEALLSITDFDFGMSFGIQ